MATGKASDFQIYNDQVYSGFTETLVQNSAVWNSASRGALQLVPFSRGGDYVYSSFIKSISGLVSRRDTTSTSGATDLAVTQGANISVKLNRKVGPIGQTLDAWKKIGRDDQHASFILGEQIAKGVEVDMLNSLLTALDSAIDGVTAMEVDADDAIINIEDLLTGLSKFGDAAGRVVAWVMHSKVYYDLMKDHVTNAIDGPANMVIVDGTAPSINRPIIVTDASCLLTTGTPDVYATLGLVAGAGVVEETEALMVESQLILGGENIVHRVQGELAYNIAVKGFQWDVGNGGANPTAGALGTSSNWDKVATDNKDIAGVRIYSQ